MWLLLEGINWTRICFEEWSTTQLVASQNGMHFTRKDLLSPRGNYGVKPIDCGATEMVH